MKSANGEDVKEGRASSRPRRTNARSAHPSSPAPEGGLRCAVDAAGGWKHAPPLRAICGASSCTPTVEIVYRDSGIFLHSQKIFRNFLSGNRKNMVQGFARFAFGG